MKNEMSKPTCADCADCVTMPGKSAGICIRTRRWVSRTDVACDDYAPYDPMTYQDENTERRCDNEQN